MLDGMGVIRTVAEIKTIEAIKRMAREAHLPMATYVGLLLSQHIRTPMTIRFMIPKATKKTTPPPPKKTTKKAS